jgi:hypothetical protein
MQVAIEHVGDLVHRMTEKPTFGSAGYEYVKNKVEKTLRWLTNPYGFGREFMENIKNNAEYDKVPYEKFRSKVFDALEVYATEHEKLPVYNEAQRLAQLAAVSLGRLQLNTTITALQKLEAHLGSLEEWVKFAHQGLS